MINADAPFIFAILLVFGGVLAGIAYEQNPQQTANPQQLAPTPPAPIVIQLQTTTPVSTIGVQTNRVPTQSTPQGR